MFKNESPIVAGFGIQMFSRLDQLEPFHMGQDLHQPADSLVVAENEYSFGDESTMTVRIEIGKSTVPEIRL